MSGPATKRKADDSNNDSAKKPKNSSITSFFGAPKPVPGAQEPNSSNSSALAATSKASKFDKDAWVKALTDEQRALLKLEIETLHDSWLPYLAEDLKHKSFLDLKRFLKEEGKSGTVTNTSFCNHPSALPCHNL